MNNEKHYNTLNNYYKQKYHKKIAKISLNAGFTCPNIDGKKGYGPEFYSCYATKADYILN